MIVGVQNVRFVTVDRFVFDRNLDVGVVEFLGDFWINFGDLVVSSSPSVKYGPR